MVMPGDNTETDRYLIQEIANGRASASLSREATPLVRVVLPKIIK